MQRPLVLAAMIAAAGCAASDIQPGSSAPASVRALASTSGGAPRRSLFPPTPSGVHLNLVFTFAVPKVKREVGLVDLVWGANAPTPRYRHVRGRKREDVHRIDRAAPASADPARRPRVWLTRDRHQSCLREIHARVSIVGIKGLSRRNQLC
jgi:hypothetical protein